jgi:hypothetical protein
MTAIHANARFTVTTERTSSPAYRQFADDIESVRADTSTFWISAKKTERAALACTTTATLPFPAFLA